MSRVRTQFKEYFTTLVARAQTTTDPQSGISTLRTQLERVRGEKGSPAKCKLQKRKEQRRLSEFILRAFSERTQNRANSSFPGVEPSGATSEER